MEITNNSTLEQIAEAISEREKDLREAIKNRGVLKERINKLRKDALEIELAKNELSTPLTKSSDNIKVIESDLRDLRAAYWGKKNV